MVPAETRARGRGLLRSLQRRPLPSRHHHPALAAGQGAAAMHAGSTEAEGRQSDEAAGSVGWAKRASRERAADGAPTIYVEAVMVGTARRARLCPPYGLIHPVASADARSGWPFCRASAAIAPWS